MKAIIVVADTEADDFDFDAEMGGVIDRVRMALAEAGYPQAHVWHEWTGIFVDGVPEDVKQRAFDLINKQRAGKDVI